MPISPDDPKLRGAAQELLDRHRENRSEASIRGAIRDFLVAGGLAPRRSIQMETQAGSGRIDLESDDLVIEVKRRIGNRLDADEANKRQLEQYLQRLAEAGRPRRLGILTDGKYWLLRRPGQPAGMQWQTVRPYAFTLDDAEHGYHLYEWLRDESQALEQRRIAPTDEQVRARLGPGPRFEQHLAALSELYGQHRSDPTVAIKRELWRRLLSAALGVAVEEQPDIEQLFLRHTYLSVVVGMAVQAAFGIDIAQRAEANAAELLNGQLFVSETGVRGVVESDFFTWPAEVGGEAWLRGIARRISRFEWARAESDIARILYESVIPADDRRRLGEYYTPDWLAREIVEAAVTDPLNQRVLDPACGSGSFIFAAVRKYIAAARAAGRRADRILDGLRNHVIGIDVHPVSVHLARATWTFAARDIIEEARDLGGGADAPAPVYLGDSLQLRTQGADLFSAHTVTIELDREAGGDAEAELEFAAPLDGRRLEFPRALVEQADWFDSLMARLADELEQDGDPLLALDDERIPAGADRSMLERTAATLQALHAEGRDHIWSYYVRNLVRPIALSADPVDVLVGNPPWLTYNKTNAVVRTELERQSKSVYSIWTGGRYATHQDTAGLFFSRCVDLYLKPGGAAAMVLPHSALQTGQYSKWRRGAWGRSSVDLNVRCPWDLERIEPNTFFPVPACVVFARRSGAARPLSATADRWRGPAGGPFKREQVPLVDTSGGFASPYGKRARNGATIVPRCLFFVNIEAPQALVRAQQLIRTSPRRGSQDKRPWKDLDLQELAGHSIEAEHIWDVHLGETVAPYVLLEPLKAVLPLSRTSGELVKQEGGLHGLDPRRLGPRMRRRWRTINALWDEHKSANNKLSLLEQIDYMRKLSVQRLGGSERYSKGTRKVLEAACTRSE